MCFCMCVRPTKKLRFSYFLAIIAVKIAGSIGILPCCALNDLFSHRGMNVCLICEASLSRCTLCMGHLVPAYTMYHVFRCWPKKKMAGKNKKCVTALILKQTDDQKPETFFLGLKNLKFVW